MRPLLRGAEAVSAKRKHYERLAEPDAKPDLLHRQRFNELALCQYPDQECNAPRHMGTGFCSAHVATMRERACEEIRESYGMCSELEVA
jgi:hypothetical protein